MKKSDFLIGLFATLSIFFIFLVLFSTFSLGIFIDNEDRGTFGDMFGAANALFTGLSFVGLIVTILLQREDLKETRNEMELTRKEFISQNDTMKLQQFENTFFQMLSLFNSIVNNTEFWVNTNEYKGRSAFAKVYDLMYLDAKREANTRSNMLESEIKQNLESMSLEAQMIFYEKNYNLYKEYLGHYFRTFYHIVKLIDTTPNINKRRYISLARAQLSSFEIILFLFNGLHKNGFEKFKPLIEKYTLFNNIDEELLINIKPLKEYLPTAFNYPEEIE